MQRNLIRKTRKEWKRKEKKPNLVSDNGGGCPRILHPTVPYQPFHPLAGVSFHSLYHINLLENSFCFSAQRAVRLSNQWSLRLTVRYASCLNARSAVTKGTNKYKKKRTKTKTSTKEHQRSKEEDKTKKARESN